MNRFYLWRRAGNRVQAFVTLTSAVDSQRRLLRRHWRDLREEWATKMKIAPSQIEYVGVDTIEGNGVLHLVVSLPRHALLWRAGRPFFPFAWLHEAWERIHGARQLDVGWLYGGERGEEKLASYMVAQYIAEGQGDASLRLAQSRASVNWGRLWRQLTGVWRGRAQVRMYESLHRLGALGEAEFLALRRDWWRLRWQDLRRAWRDLLSVGRCELEGDSFFVGLRGVEAL